MSNREASAPAAKSGVGRKAIRALGAIDNGIAWFEGIILAWGVILMALNAVVNVLGRTFLGQSLYFSEELNQFLIVLITFMGMGYAARKGRHIRMSAIYDQLGETGRKVLMVLMCAVTAAVMFYLAYYSYGYVERIHRMGKVTPALQVPLYLTYVWVPIGFAITGIQYLLTVIKNLTHREVYVSYEHVDSYEDTEQTGVQSGL